MFNTVGLLQMIVLILVLGTLSFFAWDQIALALKWPRPSWGAGVSIVYFACLANFLSNNQIVVGRGSAHPSQSSRNSEETD